MPDDWKTANGFDLSVDNSMDDPDGDGLPNLAEYELHCDPNSPDNPLNLSLPGSATISGAVTFPLALSAGLGQSASVQLYVNAAPAGHAYVQKSANGAWSCALDTTSMRNGQYWLQLVYNYPESDFSELDANFMPHYAYGVPKLVVVNNPLTFDDLTSVFTTTLFVKAKVNVPADSYSIDLYDQNNQYLKTLIGGILGGKIDTSWDLSGGPAVNGPLRADVSLSNSQTGAGAGSPALTTRFGWEPSVLGDRIFAVAWADTFPTLQADRAWQTMMQTAVVDNLSNPGSHEYYLLPPENRWNSPPPFRLIDRKRSHDYLLSWLPYADCFFAAGHTSIRLLTQNGRDSGLPYPHHAVLAEQVAAKLGFDSPWAPQSDKAKDPHCLRLAILYGCNSYSFEWANAFGVPFSAGGSKDTTASYLAAGRAPRAFVGWTTETTSANTEDTIPEFGYGYAALFDGWMGGNTIENCMMLFRAQTYNYQGAFTWEISGCRDLMRKEWW